MLLLATIAHPTVVHERAALTGGELLGRLLTPRHYWRAADTAAAGIPWAADNDGFNGVDVPAFVAMLDTIAGLPGCRFVTAPDVVADATETARLFDEWAPRIRASGLPVALVLQDGLAGPEDVPWDELDAVFVGGTDAFKLGAVARELVAEASARGLWAHVGRVNSIRRIAYAATIGADSVDGSKYARWRTARLPTGLLAILNATENTPLALDL